ncbi:MAG: hypothetical protein GXO45_04205, partial [Aquificae bacterium]|nr:hypothetical protein [Aquificota bacterium]
MEEKKRWALETAKSFYREIDKRFSNVNSIEEAVEIFKGLFISEREFYKHIRKHIIENLYNTEVLNWLEAKSKDLKCNHK